MKKLFVFLLLFFITSPLAYGAVYDSGERVSLSSGVSVRDNFYAGGGEITISDNVLKDLVIAGADVSITGDVGDDLLAGGGSVQVFGDVSGDARIGGGSLTLSSNVYGDLLAGGGVVNVLPTSVIYKDAIIGGGRVVIGGDVKGDLVLGAEDVVISGEVFGDIDARVSGNFVIEDGAVIHGDLTYFARKDVRIEDGASVLGNVTLNKMEISSVIGDYDIFAKGIFTVISVFLFVKLLALLFIGLLLVWLLKKFSSEVVQASLKNIWRELLRGFIVLIIVPALAVLFLLTIIGSVASVLLLVVYVLLLVMASIYSGIVLGGMVFKYAMKQKTITVNMTSALTGILLLYVIGLVPFVGWIIQCFFFLVTLGGVSIVLFRKFK